MKWSIKRFIQVIPIVVALLSGAVISHAIPITPTSYEMPNGYGTGSYYGEYNYWDVIYSGNGAVSGDGPSILKNKQGEYLTGGLGKLTDGKIAERSWEWYEPYYEGGVLLYNYRTLENFYGTGPYVGWTISPTITFHFANPVTLDNITFYVDNPGYDKISTGYYKDTINPHGAVAAPTGFTIGGTSYSSGVDGNVEGTGPVAINIDDLRLANIRDLTVTINRDIHGDARFWLFVSEITFDDGVPPPVPEPSTLVLLGAGIAGFALLRNRRRQ
jgi:hypothetical protein